ncbi:MAG TPA: hypothetical protein VLH56_18700 [Dissulfurispiraceae bacterium]|nr:hypothetical protein [Dissulfurispiraceae bacterium]
MAITRGKSGKAPQTAEDAERKHRKKDKARTVYGMAVMLHQDGTMEIGSRTYFRKKYVIQNDRIRDAVETGKPLVSRGKTYFMRNATPEEEANV